MGFSKAYDNPDLQGNTLAGQDWVTGLDWDVVDAVRERCDKNHIGLYLANVEHTEIRRLRCSCGDDSECQQSDGEDSGECYCGMSSEREIRLLVTRLVDLNGNELARDLMMNNGHISS